MADELGGGGSSSGRKRRKKDGNAKLLKGEKVEVRFIEDGLKGSWHSGTIIGYDGCSRVVEYDEMMDDDCSSKLVECVTVSAAVEGIACIILGNYRGNIRPLPPRSDVDQADVRYGMCVDAFVDDAWWEGVVFDHDEASSRRLVFFPDQGDQHIISATQLRLSFDWDEVSGAWRSRGTWLFLELLQKFEHQEPLPVSVRQIWYDVRSHSSFTENIGDWIFGSWPLWHELVSEVINEILSVSFGLTVPELLVDLPLDMDDTDTPIKALPSLEGNNFLFDEAGLAVANQNMGLQGMPKPPLDECAQSSCSRVCEHHHWAENILNAPAGRVCGRSALSAPGRKETMEEPGHCHQVLSAFLFEHHRKKVPHTPDSGRRYKIMREAATHHLLSVGWKFKHTARGVKFYVSPFEERYFSFIKACEAWEIVERQSLVNCSGRKENLMCNVRCTGNKVHTAQQDHDACTVSRDTEAWQPLDLEPKYCPEAMAFCTPGLLDRKHESEVMGNTALNHVDTMMKARKHLLALGWRVETKQGRLRYCSPNGKYFYSLRRICLEMMAEHEGKRQRWINDSNMNGYNSVEGSMSLQTDIHPESAPLDLEPVPSLQQKRQSKQWENHRKNVIELCVAKEYLSYDKKIKATHASFFKLVDSNGMVCAMETSCSKNVKEGQHINCSCCQFPKKKSNFYVSEGETHTCGVLSQDCNPEAVADYIRYNESRGRKGKKRKASLDDDDDDIRQIRMKVKKHLLSVGWTVCVRVRGDRKEQCYHSPWGRSYYSLHTACKAYMKGKCLKIATGRSGGCLMKWKQYEGCSAEDFSGCVETNPRSNVCSSTVEGVHCDRQGSTFTSKSSHHGKLHHFIINGRGIRKVKNRRLKATFPSSSLSLCQRLIKYSSDHGKGNSKSRKRKSSQSLIKQHDMSGSRSLRRASRSSKRARQVVASSPDKHFARSILTLLIDNNVILPRQKVSYVRKRDGHVLKEGRITRDGIKCRCCEGVFSISNFEAHAGSSNHRPAANIFLQDGRSLLQCQEQMRDKNKPKEFPHKRRKRDYSSYQNDSICSMCQDGGSLVLCDHCPSSFHMGCLGLEEVPDGKWFCPSCRCSICGLSEFNCDPEQFNEKTVIYCDQCEREYHVGCLRKRGLVGLECCPVGNWFCSKSCSQIFLRLRRLLGKTNPTSVDGLSWTILRTRKESDPDLDVFDMETVAEHHCRLSVALDVMHECFKPITEPCNNGDLVADIIFNKESELNRINFWGFYTMLLQRGDELISVATFRVFGEKIAEMPLVGTRIQYRRKGMCRLLMNELEKLLSTLGVERLLLPAVPELLETWTTSFGFSKMTNSERLVLSEFTLLSFQETTMCQKLLRNSNVTRKESNGNHGLLLGASYGKMDCDNTSIISEVVEMVDPIKSLPSSADEPCAMIGKCVSVGEIKYLTDAADSPSSSYCLHMLGGLIQEENETIQSQVTEQISANASSGKCSDGCPITQRASPTIKIKQVTDSDRRFTGKFYVRGKNRTGREWPRNACARDRGTFNGGTYKYFYKRRILAT